MKVIARSKDDPDVTITLVVSTGIPLTPNQMRKIKDLELDTPYGHCWTWQWITADKGVLVLRRLYRPDFLQDYFGMAARNSTSEGDAM